MTKGWSAKTWLEWRLSLTKRLAGMSLPFSFKAYRQQVKSDTINPRDGLNLLRRQSCPQCLATRVSQEFGARAFINVELREKSLEA
jgi:hypothetical protein